MTVEDVLGLLDELRNVTAHQALRRPAAPTEYEYGRMVGVYNAFVRIEEEILKKMKDKDADDGDL